MVSDVRLGFEYWNAHAHKPAHTQSLPFWEIALKTPSPPLLKDMWCHVPRSPSGLIMGWWLLLNLGWFAFDQHFEYISAVCLYMLTFIFCLCRSAYNSCTSVYIHISPCVCVCFCLYGVALRSSLALPQLPWPDRQLAGRDCPLIKPLYHWAHGVQGGCQRPNWGASSLL